jgi:hypothetical protein
MPTPEQLPLTIRLCMPCRGAFVRRSQLLRQP